MKANEFAELFQARHTGFGRRLTTIDLALGSCALGRFKQFDVKEKMLKNQEHRLAIAPMMDGADT